MTWIRSPFPSCTCQMQFCLNCVLSFKSYRRSCGDSNSTTVLYSQNMYVIQGDIILQQWLNQNSVCFRLMFNACLNCVQQVSKPCIKYCRRSCRDKNTSTNFVVGGIKNMYSIPLFLTLLHSEQPKLYGVLAVLSATGLKGRKASSNNVRPDCELISPLPLLIVFGNYWIQGDQCMSGSHVRITWL